MQLGFVKHQSKIKSEFSTYKLTSSYQSTTTTTGLSFWSHLFLSFVFIYQLIELTNLTSRYNSLTKHQLTVQVTQGTPEYSTGRLIIKRQELGQD
jgi:hypothetical protein